MRDTLAYQVVIRQSELLAEAAHERLVREAQPRSNSMRRIGIGALAIVGQSMVTLGSALRARNSRSSPEVALSPCPDAR